MGLILRLAMQSLKSRVLTTWLTITSIALSVTLLVGIEHLRAGVRESFAGTISGTDLIVGARGGSLQVLLSTVFGIGTPAGSVSMKTFERWKAHPAVKWAVPYTLGDSHRGFRVVGTTTDFFERYRFRKTGTVVFVQGRAPTGDDEVAIGSDVEEKLQYALNAPVVVTHGMQDIGTSNHETHPFHVVGILARTFTPIDRSVYMTLGGVEGMHEVEQGRMPAASASPATAAAKEPNGPTGADKPNGQTGPLQPNSRTKELQSNGRTKELQPNSRTKELQPNSRTKELQSNSRKTATAAETPSAAQQAANAGAPPVMPGASPPPNVATAASAQQSAANASAPPVMPGASLPPNVAAAAGARQAANSKAPPVMPGASPSPNVAAVVSSQQAANAKAPPLMPGASPPPNVAAAASAQQAANSSAPLVMPGASAPQVMPGATPPVMPGAAQPVTKSIKQPQATTVMPVGPPAHGEAGHDHGDDQITAFFVGTKNRFEALMLQREMNTDFTEPLTAVIPGVALAELFNSIGSAEVGLRVVALFAVAIGLTGMLVALYSSLDARRREMAILRSVGAGPGTIVSLLVIESGLLAFLGCAIGVGFVYLGLVLGQGPIEQRFGLHLSIGAMKAAEYNYLAIILGAGVLVGFVPAWKAYRTSLSDGLSPRT